MKIESHKMNIKAKSKIGSLDNVDEGDAQTNGHKVTLILCMVFLIMQYLLPIVVGRVEVDS